MTDDMTGAGHDDAFIIPGLPAGIRPANRFALQEIVADVEISVGAASGINAEIHVLDVSPSDDDVAGVRYGNSPSTGANGHVFKMNVRPGDAHPIFLARRFNGGLRPIASLHHDRIGVRAAPRGPVLDSGLSQAR